MPTNMIFRFFFLLILFQPNLNAQLSINNIELFSELKKTTTLVFMPSSDTVKHQIYRELMETYWKLTPMQFMSYTQFKEYKDKKGYSYLLFGDDFINDGISINSYVYFELWQWQSDKDNWEKRKKAQLARIELYPDPETTFDPSLIYDYRYNTEGHIFNWTPGMFKNYLQLMNRHIGEGLKKTASKFDADMAELRSLRTATLYVPEYVLEQHSSSQKKLRKIPAMEMMADYPYPYKVVSNETLSRLILDSKENVYYLLFIRSNSDKYLTVMEGKEGKFIYQKHSPQSFNVKKSDLKRLAKVIVDAG
jgi:hypothetical protein